MSLVAQDRSEANISRTESTLRPVTPLGIVARGLERLRAHATELGYDDPAFVELLAETTRLASDLDPYLEACTSPASPALAALAKETLDHDWSALHGTGATSLALESEMVSGHLEGRFLAFLTRATRATRVLEIGCFTGYSALAMAEALPPDGTLVACEIDAYAARVARGAFDRSPDGAKIEILVGPALATLARLRDEGATFDLVFVDADKTGYARYLDAILDGGLLAPHGLVAVDNTLLQGEPYRAASRTPNGEAIAAFNLAVADDPRVEQVLVPIRDGVTLIRRVS